jgi:hypothetical protein
VKPPSLSICRIEDKNICTRQKSKNEEITGVMAVGAANGLTTT